MRKTEDLKFRHELKYLITNGQLALLKQRMSHLLRIDPHVAHDGIYNIRSLYFDDYYDRCLFENIAGSDPREKFRIRIYNHSPERISLECKRKERGMTQKSACLISREICERLMKCDPLSDIPDQNAVLRKFTNEIRMRRMHPAVIVEYDRIPYIYKDGNVRITLDTNVSSSPCLDGLLNGVIPKRPVMPAGMQLLEVKFDEFLPDVIYRALQLDSLRQTAYSKYYLCRRYSMR